MKLWVGSLILCLALSVSTAEAQQRGTVKVAVDPQRGSAPPPADSQRFMRVYGTALPPYAFVEFCQRLPEYCSADGAVSDTRLEGTSARLKQLDEINRHVNRVIKPATDMELYGVPDYWTIPTDKGDCEDYALLKRKILIEKGWPISSLLMTVVRDEKGEGHAILTARLSTGDYVLDNKVDDMKLWSQTPYQYVMRQSYLNPRVWMSLDPRDAGQPGTLAGLLGLR
jgi:predicted transglutaminase-like cysteine proteinase